MFIVRFRVMGFRGFAGAGDFGGALLLARNNLAGNEAYAGFIDVSYPFPVGLIALPFTAFDDRLAASLFFALSSGLLSAVVVGRTGQPWRLLMFLSLPFAHALEWAQWSSLIMASWYLSFLAPVLLTVKPQIAPSVAVSRVSLAGSGVAVLILIVSFVVQPSWLSQWIDRVEGYQYIIPILQPGGFLLLLSVPFLRCQKARLLLLMGVLPVREAQDLVPLFIFPFSVWQMILIVAASWVLPLRQLHLLYMIALAAVWLRRQP